MVISGVLPLEVQRGGGGQGAPVAEGRGRGVHAVAVHACCFHQALLSGDCFCLSGCVSATSSFTLTPGQHLLSAVEAERPLKDFLVAETSRFPLCPRAASH